MTQGMQVLVVEDNPATRHGYKELLRVWGFEPRTAHNGLEALVEIRHARPQIVLSDLEMPGMNGYELLTILRRIYPEIRVVAMSGSYAGNEIPRGVFADAFYPKGAGSFQRLRALLSEAGSAAPQSLRARRSEMGPLLSWSFSAVGSPGRPRQ